MRLQAFLARSGASPSRRKAEALISAGRVQINDRIASLGESITPDDRVLLDGKLIELPHEHAYLALKRVRVGPVKLGGLPEGRYRELTEKELEILENIERRDLG